MFNFIKKALRKIYDSCTSKLGALFSRTSIDAETIREVERILLEADAGVAITKKIKEQLEAEYKAGTIPDGAKLQQSLEKILIDILSSQNASAEGAVLLLVGINGSGKTTLASKLAYAAKKREEKVLFVAADTFRAAAQEQLGAWATRLEIDIITGKQGQDPSSVVFTGCQAYAQGNYQKLIIDTAGRLQTKTNLMKELEKIKRVIVQKLPNAKITTILTIDAMLGQNSFEQARIFHESTSIDGIALTKMDGTGKGGIIFAIVHELRIPVLYISYGEALENLKHFDAHEYVHALLYGDEET